MELSLYSSTPWNRNRSSIPLSISFSASIRLKDTERVPRPRLRSASSLASMAWYCSLRLSRASSACPSRWIASPELIGIGQLIAAVRQFLCHPQYSHLSAAGAPVLSQSRSEMAHRSAGQGTGRVHSCPAAGMLSCFAAIISQKRGFNKKSPMLQTMLHRFNTALVSDVTHQP